MKNFVKAIQDKMEAITGISSVHTINYKSKMTVNDWLSWYEISMYDLAIFPNAKTAAEIKASPLGKALE